jgi:UDP-3-O-[3-hydroxymyristoyl] glucosamine N-acyltransferase
MKKLTAEKIAEITGGEIKGDKDAIISGLNRIEHAGHGELTFFSDESFREYFENTEAACVIIKKDNDKEPAAGQAFVLADNPYKSFAETLMYIDSLKSRPKGFVHPSATVSETSVVPPDAYIGPNCHIGENCTIGKGLFLHSNISIYENCTIGDNCRVHSGATICADTVIGDDCELHHGCVIGSDGFGFIENKDGSYNKIPQLGNVRLGDRVEIGANTTIDRSIVGSTIIGDGVKIDNLCQIAHNCEIGENTAMASQAGVSGSVKIGSRVRLAGQVGVAGHIEICDDVTIYAQSGVARAITRPGIYFGSPAKDRMEAFKIEAVIRRLPEIARDVEHLKKK